MSPARAVGGCQRSGAGAAHLAGQRLRNGAELAIMAVTGLAGIEATLRSVAKHQPEAEHGARAIEEDYVMAAVSTLRLYMNRLG